MTEIHRMTEGHPYWDATVSLAANCSWRAGPVLAEKMKQHAFAEWESVFCAAADGKVVGFCTLAAKDELPAAYDFTPFIGFVFVDESYRGNRISEQMLHHAAAYAQELGYQKVYIMSGEIGLYEKYGFQKLGDYETTYGTVDQLFVKALF